MSATVSKLIVVFKDSLMSTPFGLRYRISANKKTIAEGTVKEDKQAACTYIFTTDSKSPNATVKQILPTETSPIEIPKANNYEIKIELLDEKGGLEKDIGTSNLGANGKELSITAISPWTYIPLSPGKSAGSGDFFNVEYNIRNQGNKVNTVKVQIHDIPRKIVLTALKHRGSTEWSYYASKTTYNRRLENPDDQSFTFIANTNKCNVFVYDVFEEVGISIPWIERGKGSYIPWVQGKMYPPLSEDWHNPKRLAHIFSSESNPMPGDVGAFIANYADASGHTGIILADGVTISAGGNQVEVNDAGFRHKNRTATSHDHDFSVFRRYKRKEIR